MIELSKYLLAIILIFEIVYLRQGIDSIHKQGKLLVTKISTAEKLNREQKGLISSQAAHNKEVPANPECPPEVEVSDPQKITVKYKEVPIRELLLELATIANLNVILDEAVQGSTGVNIKDRDAREVFFQVLEEVNLDSISLHGGSNIYRVGKKNEIELERKRRREDYRQRLEQYRESRKS